MIPGLPTLFQLCVALRSGPRELMALPPWLVCRKRLSRVQARACKRRQIGELVQRAGELGARLLAQPSQVFMERAARPSRTKQGSAVRLAEYLNAVMISLREDRAA